ncbi:MAG: [protein-PII] uridylyltransferase [Actinomycetota bacterium]|jgi:[protein-PII] uridylyltransferase|nr:[protein-PII] uridylyltransferase [Actinomycetota bacterium]
MRSELAAVLAQRSLIGADLRSALVELYDGWLADLFGDQGPGVSLLTVGALGRRDPAPGSDLDLVLLHDGRADIATLAEKLWYPIWDTGVGLDHSVRTVDEALAVARGDLKAALGLLDARHLAGDASLSATLISAARAAWRQGAANRLPELRAFGEERARTAGEVAFLLEPDLKEARGGLRDIHALHALAVAQVADPPSGATLAAHHVLLDVRGELHRRTVGSGRRTVDRLLMQEQDAIAAALGYGDADLLMAAVSGAARTIAFSSDVTWRRVSTTAPRRRLLGRRGPAEPARRPIGDDVLEQAGEVVLARNATPGEDPELVLRVAEAAARTSLPIAPHTLERLYDECPQMPVPWPRPALDAFVGLLAAGPAAVPVFEALDQAGLLTRLLPEWESVRSKPQRNSYHRFTVDRHLVEAAAEAAALTRRVARPDLLLLGALLHDIGKGLPGDHTETGMEVVAQIGPRLGLSQPDVDVLVAMVRHHLLLPDVATRRDLADPATAHAVADAVQSAEVLELLHALTEADAAASGPAAWSSWKAGLIDQLVARTAALLAGTMHADETALSARQEELVATGTLSLDVDGDEVTVVAPDRPGLLSLSAGVLALHRLDVRSASAFARGSTAVTVFRVTPRFGSPPDWSVVRSDLARAVEGSLDVEQKLAAKEAAYAPRTAVPVAPPTVRLVDDASETATVVEVRAPDGLGILHRITAALDDCALDVRTAHISTLGADVVDAFYVVGRDGRKVSDPAVRERVETVVLAALSGSRDEQTA